MTEYAKRIVVFGVAAVAGLQLLGSAESPPAQPAVAEVAAGDGVPAADLQAAVSQVRELAKTKRDAARALAPFYRGGADVVRRDTSNVGSVSQFTLARTTANELFMLKTPLVGSLPGLGTATEAALTQGMGGMADVSLDAEKRKRLADTLDAIGWALEGN